MILGGVYTGLTDAGTMLADCDSFTAVDPKINFLRAVRQATLMAEATVLKADSTIGHVECEVKDEQSCLVAKAACTYLKLKKS